MSPVISKALVNNTFKTKGDSFFANNEYKCEIINELPEDEIIRLKDGNMLVCSQWGILNIPNFIKRAEQLNYKINQIIKE